MGRTCRRETSKRHNCIHGATSRDACLWELKTKFSPSKTWNHLWKLRRSENIYWKQTFCQASKQLLKFSHSPSSHFHNPVKWHRIYIIHEGTISKRLRCLPNSAQLLCGNSRSSNLCLCVTSVWSQPRLMKRGLLY